MAKSCILFIVLFAFAAIQFDSGRKSIKKSFQPPIQTKQYSSPDYLRANSSFAALPTILLAGAQKGGTSALAFWLHSLNENNTGVCQAAVFDGEPDWYKKEVHFFDDDERFSRGLEFYMSRFRHCYKNVHTIRNKHGMPLIMDATPDTMRYPRRVFDTYYRARQLDKVKIIISLREPVSRDLSWFNHLKADSLEDKLGGKMEEFVLKASNRTYDDYVKDVTIPALLGQKHDDNIENGLYVKYLHTWFEKFPRSHILLLSYEEVLHNSSKARERVERFLDQRFPLSENSANWQHVNAKDSPEKVLEPSCRVQDKLARTFDLYNEQLYALLDSKAKRRPPSEQHPFPRFELGNCTGESWKIIHRHPSDTPDQVSSFSSNVAKRKNSTSLPTILIAGAQKSATSAISFWLRQPNKKNNGVCKAHVFDYEPEWHSNQVHFFNRDDRFYNGLEFYEKRFKHCYDDKDVTKTESGMPLILDATPDTLRHPRRVFEMYEKAGRLNKVKIIFSLREPISRDISWFNHKKANKVHNQTYADYVRDVTIPALLGQKPDGGIENGLYAKYLKTWFKLFPRRNILILSYHEILHNSSKIRERVETFLGQSFPLNENSTNWQWQTKKDYIGKVVKPMCKTRAVLDRLFEPHNDHLYALLESSSNDRPIMEEYPFPRFEEVECVPQSY